MNAEDDGRAMDGCNAPPGQCDAKRWKCVPGERDPSHDHCKFGQEPPALFKSDLWQREPIKGETMFIHTYWDGKYWQTGLGYWCKDGGWAGSQTGRNGREHLATHFHPMPEPPR